MVVTNAETIRALREVMVRFTTRVEAVLNEERDKLSWQEYDAVEKHLRMADKTLTDIILDIIERSISEYPRVGLG